MELDLAVGVDLVDETGHAVGTERALELERIERTGTAVEVDSVVEAELAAEVEIVFGRWNDNFGERRKTQVSRRSKCQDLPFLAGPHWSSTRRTPPARSRRAAGYQSQNQRRKGQNHFRVRSMLLDDVVE